MMKGTVLITGASAGLGAEFARQLDGKATHFISVSYTHLTLPTIQTV